MAVDAQRDPLRLTRSTSRGTHEHATRSGSELVSSLCCGPSSPRPNRACSRRGAVASAAGPVRVRALARRDGRRALPRSVRACPETTVDRGVALTQGFGEPRRERDVSSPTANGGPRDARADQQSPVATCLRRSACARLLSFDRLHEHMFAARTDGKTASRLRWTGPHGVVVSTPAFHAGSGSSTLPGGTSPPAAAPQNTERSSPPSTATRLARDVARARRAQERRRPPPSPRRVPSRPAGTSCSRGGHGGLAAAEQLGQAVGGDAAGEDGVERHAVGRDLAGDRLEGGEHRDAVGVGEHQVRDRLAHARRSRRSATRPKPRSRMPGMTRLDERHRAEDERAVGGLPLLAREAERVGAAGRPAGVADEDVDRPERLLDLGDQRPRRGRGRRCRARSRRADLGRGRLDRARASAR